LSVGATITGILVATKPDYPLMSSFVVLGFLDLTNVEANRSCERSISICSGINTINRRVKKCPGYHLGICSDKNVRKS
jgi:hypothetical protein